MLLSNFVAASGHSQDAHSSPRELSSSGEELSPSDETHSSPRELSSSGEESSPSDETHSSPRELSSSGEELSSLEETHRIPTELSSSSGQLSQSDVQFLPQRKRKQDTKNMPPQKKQHLQHGMYF